MDILELFDLLWKMLNIPYGIIERRLTQFAPVVITPGIETA
jgi:hypothetical protein